MVERANEIWANPTTSFQPVQRQIESRSLDDEDVDLTGRNIQKYNYLGTEQPAASWTEMFENMVRFLHQQVSLFCMVWQIAETPPALYDEKAARLLFRTASS